MSLLKKYEIIILLNKEFNEQDLKIWISNYAQYLKKYDILNILTIYQDQKYSVHSMNNKLKGIYIQLNFYSMPKYIKNISKFLILDIQVLKFLVFNM